MDMLKIIVVLLLSMMSYGIVVSGGTQEWRLDLRYFMCQDVDSHPDKKNGRMVTSAHSDSMQCRFCTWNSLPPHNTDMSISLFGFRKLLKTLLFHWQTVAALRGALMTYFAINLRL